MHVLILQVFRFLAHGAKLFIDHFIKTEKAFQHADINKKGYLNREDLTVGITAALGYQPTEFEVDQFLRNANGGMCSQILSLGKSQKNILI